MEKEKLKEEENEMTIGENWNIENGISNTHKVLWSNVEGNLEALRDTSKLLEKLSNGMQEDGRGDPFISESSSNLSECEVERRLLMSQSEEFFSCCHSCCSLICLSVFGAIIGISIILLLLSYLGFYTVSIFYEDHKALALSFQISSLFFTMFIADLLLICCASFVCSCATTTYSNNMFIHSVWEMSGSDLASDLPEEKGYLFLFVEALVTIFYKSKMLLLECVFDCYKIICFFECDCNCVKKKFGVLKDEILVYFFTKTQNIWKSCFLWKIVMFVKEKWRNG